MKLSAHREPTRMRKMRGIPWLEVSEPARQLGGRAPRRYRRAVLGDGAAIARAGDGPVVVRCPGVVLTAERQGYLHRAGFSDLRAMVVPERPHDADAGPRYARDCSVAQLSESAAPSSAVREQGPSARAYMPSDGIRRAQQARTVEIRACRCPRPADAPCRCSFLVSLKSSRPRNPGEDADRW